MFGTTLVWGLTSMFYLYLLYEMADEEIKAYTLYVLDSCCCCYFSMTGQAADKSQLSESNHPLNPSTRESSSSNA